MNDIQVFLSRPLLRETFSWQYITAHSEEDEQNLDTLARRAVLEVFLEQMPDDRISVTLVGRQVHEVCVARMENVDVLQYANFLRELIDTAIVGAFSVKKVVK